MNVSRIDLADATSPEAIISALLKAEPNLPIPIPIEKLCKQLDIRGIEKRETDGFEGMLITQPEKTNGIILCNKNSHYPRQRFTIAHELGHFLIPSHKPKDGKFICSIEDMRQHSQKEENRQKKMEVEANRFAALLLMPPPKFRADVNENSEPDIRNILKLAKKYGTSKNATSRMYIEYFDMPCAIVVGREGKVLRYYRGKDFPHIEPKSGTEFPNYSLSKRSGSLNLGASEIEEVDAGIWIDFDNEHRKPKLYEQILIQQERYSLTLLSLEELDEEEEYEEDWIVKI